MRRTLPPCLLLLVAIAPPAFGADATPMPGFDHFITRTNDKLMDGDREWRSIGVNCPGLLFAQDGYLPSLPTAWEQEDVFQSMRQMGLTSVRLFVPSIRKPYGEPSAVRRHILGPGKFDEESFQGFSGM